MLRSDALAAMNGTTCLGATKITLEWRDNRAYPTHTVEMVAKQGGWVSHFECYLCALGATVRLPLNSPMEHINIGDTITVVPGPGGFVVAR